MAGGSLAKGDLVKPRTTGGHVMTVTKIDRNNGKIEASYTTPDGKRHDEIWPAGDLKRVEI